MKEARWWRPLEDKKVQCFLCRRRCVIFNGGRGVCGVRINKDGKLYSLIYGKLTDIMIDPIEKKPLFHFYPNSLALSLGTVGCNFFCPWCQNWVISRAIPNEKGNFAEVHGYRISLNEYSPEEVFIDGHYHGVAYTYNEPTINLEFYLEVMKEARKRDLYNVFVTNGYITEEALEDVYKYLDAANIDLKSFNKEKSRRILGIDLDELLDSIIQFHKRKIWIELTHLIVTKFNDNEEEFRRMVKWIVENLGDEVPLHVTRYYPAYRYNEPPTNIDILFKFRDIAKEEGLKYVYVGNVGTGENTYCPVCGELLIERRFMRVVRWNLTDDFRCPKCGTKIKIVGDFVY